MSICCIIVLMFNNGGQAPCIAHDHVSRAFKSKPPTPISTQGQLTTNSSQPDANYKKQSAACSQHPAATNKQQSASSQQLPVRGKGPATGGGSPLNPPTLWVIRRFELASSQSYNSGEVPSPTSPMARLHRHPTLKKLTCKLLFTLLTHREHHCQIYYFYFMPSMQSTACLNTAYKTK